MNFTKYVQQYKTGKSGWDNPISCGYNIENFDNKITTRLCKKYGPYDKTWDNQNLFHPTHSIDLMRDIWRWTESRDMRSISMDSVRKWMGIDDTFAHNAIKDVLDCAFLAIKFLKLYRFYNSKVTFENSFEKENKVIASMMEKIKVR